jgi:hypothetical protein
MCPQGRVDTISLIIRGKLIVFALTMIQVEEDLDLQAAIKASMLEELGRWPDLCTALQASTMKVRHLDPSVAHAKLPVGTWSLWESCTTDDKTCVTTWDDPPP